MDNKNFEIIKVKNNIGWAYPEMKWLGEKELKSVNKEMGYCAFCLKKPLTVLCRIKFILAGCPPDV
jgi:hypothetical protein